MLREQKTAEQKTELYRSRSPLVSSRWCSLSLHCESLYSFGHNYWLTCEHRNTKAHSENLHRK